MVKEKENTKSEKSLLNETADSKKKMLRSKAGGSLEEAVRNVKQIFKVRNIF